MDHPEENRFSAAVRRYREPEDSVAVTAYVAAVAGRMGQRSEQYHVLIGTTLHSAEVTYSGGLRLNHGAVETMTLGLMDEALASDLADAINRVLAHHAAGAMPVAAPVFGHAPEVRAA